MVRSIPPMTSTGGSGPRKRPRRKSVRPGVDIKIGIGGRREAGPPARRKPEPIRSWTFASKPKFTRCCPENKYVLVEKIKEPAVRILEHVSEVVVVAYLAGVEKEEDINLELHGDILEITAQGKDEFGPKKYAKEMLLPFVADPVATKTHFENNILEIKLQEKGKGKRRKKQ